MNEETEKFENRIAALESWIHGITPTVNTLARRLLESHLFTDDMCLVRNPFYDCWENTKKAGKKVYTKEDKECLQEIFAGFIPKPESPKWVSLCLIFHSFAIILLVLWSFLK